MLLLLLLLLLLSRLRLRDLLVQYAAVAAGAFVVSGVYYLTKQF
jgi:hypothetical protein